jgi:hypothetical protein
LSNNGYWDDVSQTVIDRFDDAWDKLDDIGFEFDENYQFNWRHASTNFNTATLWKVFGLGQILSREQPITVRGAMYRAIGILIEDSSEPNYDCIKNLILKMRRLGLIPYSYISDSTRRRLKPSSWSGLADFAETVAQAYRKNLWERQSDYIEIFVEKDAMAGVVEPVTDDYDVTLNVIRGNCSETFIYRVAEIWKQIRKPIHVYYLGDHDPNGLKIEEDLYRRLEGFGVVITKWQRLAITRADFTNPEVIGFPIKKKGHPSTWQPYVDIYGDRGVEVDALPAIEIRQRVEQAILSHIDQNEWETLQLIEAEERKDVFAAIRGLGAKAA